MLKKKSEFKDDRGQKNVTFICKTDLNTDGRVLNQLNILRDSFKNITIDFILLPDEDIRIAFDNGIRIHPIKCKIRNRRLLRFITVCEWTIKATRKLFKINPQILHVQDSAVVLPVLIYLYLGGKPFVIYDDHELPNENEPIYKKLWNWLEIQLMKRADTVIFANQERLEYARARYKLSNKLIFFLNLPYTKDATPVITNESTHLSTILDIDREIESGTHFIMHQGPLKHERGRNIIARLSRILPDGYKILLVGGSLDDFKRFCRTLRLDVEKFYFVGTVPYDLLPTYWEKVIASIVIYLPTYVNNRLCAPNRLYLSFFKGVPLIVNKSNPVLRKFIEDYHAGIFIEDAHESNIRDLLPRHRGLFSTNIQEMKDSLLTQEREKILSLYRNQLD
ncbi:glycosyltransferase [Gracilibacillus dipsosauri]|uniref:glycosyltransferase n=1 Tax=Gracilibacillus dipsosauri TaxID=178340 RepID=UPI00240A15AC